MKKIENRNKQLDLPIYHLVFILFSIILSIVIINLLDLNNIFVHPENPTSHIDRIVNNYWSLNDLISPFNSSDHRPRFLTYYILLLDYRLRIFMYGLIPVFPTFSITWIFTGILAPYLFLRICKNLGQPILTSLLGLSIFLSSTGFLSGFFMFFMPGKPMVIVLLLLIFEWVSRKNISTKSTFLYLSIVVFIGFFLDELFISVIAIYPLIYIIYTPYPLGRNSIGIFVNQAIRILLPALACIIISIYILPIITQHFFNFRFNYLGAILNTQQMTQETYPVVINLKNILHLCYTLFGVSLIPWQIADFVSIPNSGVNTAQLITVPGLMILTAFFTIVFTTIIRTNKKQSIKIVFFVLSFLILIFVIGVMQSKHVPIVTGYYYACNFSVLFALFISYLTAIWYEQCTNTMKRLLIFFLVSLIAFVQLNNFLRINQNFVQYHLVNRPILGVEFEEIDIHPLTWGELSQIQNAWMAGKFDDYIKSKKFSNGSWYLIREFKGIDSLKKK